MTKFLGIISGKGGVGKTTTALNIATALNNFKRDVVVVDGNLTTPNIGVHLGTPVVSVTLHDVIKGRRKINEAMYMHPSGLKVVLASIALEELKNMDPHELKFKLKQLYGKTEMVIVDSAAGLGEESIAVMDSIDEALVIVNPSLPSITDALKAVSMAEERGVTVLGIVVNRVTKDRYELSLSNIEALIERPILGVIPEDKSVRKSLAMKHPVVYSHPHSAASVAFKKLAAELIGQRFEQNMNLTESKGLVYYFFKLIGLK